jgi:hypothetical protein
MCNAAAVLKESEREKKRSKMTPLFFLEIQSAIISENSGPTFALFSIY